MTTVVQPYPSLAPFDRFDHSHEGVDSLDPQMLGIIQWIFPNDSECEVIKFLALLCRHATVKQLSIDGKQKHYAVCSIQGITSLCKDPSSPRGYHATQRYLVLLEALMFLQRRRIQRKTQISIPLGKLDLNKEAILTNLAQKEQKHKDIKTKQLLQRVRQQIEQFGFAAGTPVIDTPLSPPILTKLASLIEEIASRLKAMNLPIKKRAILTQWIAHEVRECVQSIATEGRYFSQTGDSHQPFLPSSCHISEMGDSHSTGIAPDCTLPFQEQRNEEEPGRSYSPLLKNQAISTSSEEYVQTPHPTNSSQGNELATSSESPVSSHSDSFLKETGDSEDALSKSNYKLNNNIYVSSSFDSNQTSSNQIALTNEWQGSDEELEAETIRYMTVLDNDAFANQAFLDEYLQTGDGKKHFRGYRKRIRQNPALARASAVCALLRGYFPKGKTSTKDLGSAGAWFYSTYRRYTDPEHPMQPQPEVTVWSETSYSLQIIDSLFRAESNRQKGEGWRLQFPLPSCVETYRYDVEMWKVVADELGQIEDTPEGRDLPSKNPILLDPSVFGDEPDSESERGCQDGVPDDLLQAWQETGYDDDTVERIIDICASVWPRWEEREWPPYPYEIIVRTDDLPLVPFEYQWAWMQAQGYLFVDIEFDVLSLQQYRNLYERTSIAILGDQDDASLQMQDEIARYVETFIGRKTATNRPSLALLRHFFAFYKRIPEFLRVVLIRQPDRTYAFKIVPQDTCFNDGASFLLTSPEEVRMFVQRITQQMEREQRTSSSVALSSIEQPPLLCRGEHGDALRDVNMLEEATGNKDDTSLSNQEFGSGGIEKKRSFAYPQSIVPPGG